MSPAELTDSQLVAHAKARGPVIVQDRNGGRVPARLVAWRPHRSPGNPDDRRRRNQARVMFATGNCGTVRTDRVLDVLLDVTP